MQPTAELLAVPAVYGKPKKILDWDAVYGRLDQAERYWLATTRPDGRPHVVPVDGVWLDGIWYFGGPSGHRAPAQPPVEPQDRHTPRGRHGGGDRRGRRGVDHAVGDRRETARRDVECQVRLRRHGEGLPGRHLGSAAAGRDRLGQPDDRRHPLHLRARRPGDNPAPRPRRHGSPSSARRRPASSTNRDPDRGT